MISAAAAAAAAAAHNSTESIAIDATTVATMADIEVATPMDVVLPAKEKPILTTSSMVHKPVETGVPVQSVVTPAAAAQSEAPQSAAVAMVATVDATKVDENERDDIDNEA